MQMYKNGTSPGSQGVAQKWDVEYTTRAINKNKQLVHCLYVKTRVIYAAWINQWMFLPMNTFIWCYWYYSRLHTTSISLRENATRIKHHHHQYSIHVCVTKVCSVMILHVFSAVIMLFQEKEINTWANLSVHIDSKYYIYMYMYVCTYVYMYVCIYVCVYVRTYVCMYAISDFLCV